MIMYSPEHNSPSEPNRGLTEADKTILSGDLDPLREMIRFRELLRFTVLALSLEDDDEEEEPEEY